ncbi:MAG: hypothetical protein JNM68_11545 [Dinghuibacter sp.]|nr:hypothetical protein [Dinghuibacter sp.]
MIKRNIVSLLAILAFLSCLLPGCQQDPPNSDPDPTPPPQPVNFRYRDSILYLSDVEANNFVAPLPTGRTGTYFAWPDELEINPTTGVINLKESETGLRYKVMFVPTGTRDTFSTKIVVSGINYRDYYHVQAENDSLSRPFYNANFSQFTLPSGCRFDIGGGARAAGLAIDTVTGVINLNQSIRNGFLGHVPVQDRDKNEVEILYRIPDASGYALNKIKVKLYFYTNTSTVESDLTLLLADRTDMFFRMANNFNVPAGNMARPLVSRPRPPCVIILGQR